MQMYSASGARAWIRENFRGYFTVLYTPFDSAGEIDEGALRHNVELTLSLPGVGGLSVQSIHQEFWTMTDDERRRVTDIVLETVAGRKPVIVGVSDTAARRVVEHARHAEAAGAAAVMVWPPYYGIRTVDGVRAFYEYVAERIRGGMFAYSTTLSELGFYLKPEVAATLLPIENLCGLQNTTLNVTAYASMLEQVGDVINVSTSLEEYFLFGKMSYPERTPDFMMGCSRPLLVQNRERPLCAEFLQAALDKDFERASAKLRQIVTIADQLQTRYFAQGFHHVGLFKALSTHLGLIGGPVRPPASDPSAAELAAAYQVMRAAGLLSTAVSSALPR